MDHLSIQEKVQELSGGLCKFRIRIERVRYTFKSVEFHRHLHFPQFLEQTFATLDWEDRKSTRLNSSHITISYAVFCLKKKKKKTKSIRYINKKSNRNTS